MEFKGIRFSFQPAKYLLVDFSGFRSLCFSVFPFKTTLNTCTKTQRAPSSLSIGLSGFFNTKYLKNMSSVDSYCHREYNGITLQGYAFTFHIQITPECVSLVGISSTNKTDLNLTLYSFVAKSFQCFLLLMFCPMVSLFHKCRKLCPISGSSHLIFFVLGIYFVREGSRQGGIV